MKEITSLYERLLGLMPAVRLPKPIASMRLCKSLPFATGIVRSQPALKVAECRASELP